MNFLLGGIVVLGICFLSLVGLYESHHRVKRLLNELNEERQKTANKTKLDLVPPSPTAQNEPGANFEIYSDVAFTRSLLALSRVRSLDPYGSPVLEPVESSSSGSFHPVRSKTRDPAP